MLAGARVDHAPRPKHGSVDTIGHGGARLKACRKGSAPFGTRSASCGRFRAIFKPAPSVSTVW